MVVFSIVKSFFVGVQLVRKGTTVTFHFSNPAEGSRIVRKKTFFVAYSPCDLFGCLQPTQLKFLNDATCYFQAGH